MNVARLGLNDGAQLWIYFKLFSKQTLLLEGSHDIHIWWCINFDANGYRKRQKYGQKFICSDPIAITCCVNFDAKKGKNFGQYRGQS